MRKSMVRHPFAASVLVCVIFFVSMILGTLLVLFGPPALSNNGELLRQGVSETVVCLVGIALVAIFGYGEIWNRTEKFGKGIFAGGYIVVIAIINIVLTLTQEISSRGTNFFSDMLPAWQIIAFLVTVFLISLAEESYFRGVIANLFWDRHAKDPAGVWTATIYSGVIFGMFHLTNIIGAEPAGVIAQAIVAAAVGMMFTAIYYRTQNVWVTIFLHSINNFAGLLSAGLFGGGGITDTVSSYSPFMAVSAIPYLIVTVILLRRKKIIAMLSGPVDPVPMGYGAYPMQNAGAVSYYEVKSSPESRKSLKRVIIITVVTVLVLFVASLVLSGTISAMISEITGWNPPFEGVFSYSQSDVWSDEETFGTQFSFEVEEAGEYEIKLTSFPPYPDCYVFVQIVKGAEVCYEATYGGRCNDLFDLQFDEGEYELNLVYTSTNPEAPGEEYSFSISIE